MDDDTCGKGLAHHSSLPAKLAALAAAIADNLEIHTTALDLQDENARKEHDAYVRLAKQHRTIAAHLQATAQEMAGYVDLPMGRHDEKAMLGANVREAFSKFVKLERELLALLRASVERDEQMLAAWSALPEQG